jgi:hypothetical protein
MKKIRVRAAKERDIGLFRKLWKELLDQNVNNGSIISSDKKSLELFEFLFNSYVEQTLEGTVLFVGEKGILMWGEPASTIQYSKGKVVAAWGHYVSPDDTEGVEEALLTRAEAWAKEKGFSGVAGQFYTDPPEGFEPWATIAYRSFNE